MEESEKIIYKDVREHLKLKEVLLPQGNLYTICNVLNDYADLLQYASKEEDKTGFEKAYYMLESEKCKKIQKAIEDAIGYSVEDAIKKCERKRKRESESDIVADALALAVKFRK